MVFDILQYADLGGTFLFLAFLLYDRQVILRRFERHLDANTEAFFNIADQLRNLNKSVDTTQKSTKERSKTQQKTSFDNLANQYHRKQSRKL